MRLEEAINKINSNPETYLKPAKKVGYICPVCGDGSGKSGTGIRKDDETHFKCFKCNTYGDIVEFIKKAEHLTDFTEALKRACEIYSIDYKSIEFNGQNKVNTQPTQHKQPTHYQHSTEPKQPVEKETTETTADIEKIIRADIEEAQKHLEENDYITKKRGISLETAKKFKLGYLKEWKHPNARNKPKISTAPCLIIPTGDLSYTARNLTENISSGERYKNAGKVAIFNEQALYDTTKPCFICEGEIDALSILDLGYNAVATGGAGQINLLKTVVENAPKRTSYIIYFDTDSEANGYTGQRNAEKVYNILKELGANVINITGKEELYHDVNDYFIAMKESLVVFLNEAINELNREKEEAKLEYINTNNALAYVDDFLNGIKNSVNTPYTSTGFKELDKILDGGLYEGLYILGAISSLGKTTFILQIADQIAKAGHDVLFFSLEQARTELMAKSISRETALYCEKQNISTNNAKSNRGVTVASRYTSYSDLEKEVIRNAINEYKSTTAKNLFIFEGVADITIKQIKETVEKHIAITGNKPIVFIDYLQILAPYDDKNRTDKQTIDLNITALKRLSRSLKLSIVGISSFNRDNYNTSVNMSSFKESGAIEYSSDVLIGLQFKGIDDIKQSDSNKSKVTEFIEEAKAKNPREVELKLLKNRNGETSTRGLFKYYPIFNLYEEVTEEEQLVEEAYTDYKTYKAR